MWLPLHPKGRHTSVGKGRGDERLNLLRGGRLISSQHLNKALTARGGPTWLRPQQSVPKQRDTVNLNTTAATKGVYSEGIPV